MHAQIPYSQTFLYISVNVSRRKQRPNCRDQSTFNFNHLPVCVCVCVCVWLFPMYFLRMPIPEKFDLVGTFGPDKTQRTCVCYNIWFVLTKVRYYSNHNSSETHGLFVFDLATQGYQLNSQGMSHS